MMLAIEVRNHVLTVIKRILIQHTRFAEVYDIYVSNIIYYLLLNSNTLADIEGYLDSIASIMNLP